METSSNILLEPEKEMSNEDNLDFVMDEIIINTLIQSTPMQTETNVSTNKSQEKISSTETSNYTDSNERSTTPDNSYVNMLENIIMTTIKPKTNTNENIADTVNELIAVESNKATNKSNDTASKITELQSSLKYLSKFPDAYKLLAIKIYLKYPEAYKMLQKTLGFPSLSDLKILFSTCPISTNKGTLFESILQYKLSIMSEKQKQCVICIGAAEVDKNVYYDIKRDKLMGIYDINETQKPEPASKVLILSVQGIFADWQQPIDIAYLSRHKDVNLNAIREWVERNVRNLLELGFNIRGLVCDTDYLTLGCSLYYEICNQKIYYIYDIYTLFKWLFYTMTTHDFKIFDVVCKYQYILDYFELDSKNLVRLSPKLTEEILKPVSAQALNVKDIFEVLSLNTAAAMTTYVNFGALDSPATRIVEVITKLSELLRVLLSEENDGASVESDSRVLRGMMVFFSNLIIINRITNRAIPDDNTFKPKFRVTMETMLKLYKDVKGDDRAHRFLAKRLSLENIRTFFEKVVKNKSTLTCKTVHFAFLQFALQNVIKPISEKKHLSDLETALNEIKDLVVNKFRGYQQDVESSVFTIKCSEYNTLKLYDEDLIVKLAGYLLKKCYDRHQECDKMKSYVTMVLHDTSSLCKTILTEIQEGVCVVPQEEFIEFVEMMEIRFRTFMSKDIIATQSGLINGLLKAMVSARFSMPCNCFPILYAKKLYLRVRIYDMLKYNNNLYKTTPGLHTYLIINDY